MHILTNKRAFTLAETVVAIAFTVVLMTIIGSFYNTTRGVNSAGTAGQMLQDGSNLVLSKIIEGKTEPTGVYRLAEATNYSIASLSELHFWGTDGIERWFKLNGTSTQLLYHHPTSSGTIDEVIYTVPANATLTLRFWVPAVANYSAAVVGIDAALTQTVLKRSISGSSTTIVNLRNHP